ncbi:putative histone-lysine N-methyltransferase ASH1L-like [Scophthalmus maximus]|uniref:Putative histone-lysine N-methyltransferase ASH1L-like n=1 Tax=Scophthalmus maximus TaxID=52904 RepID=A0A2U9AYB2_SCOMX|nr:putative histone-lysine N-methyltransferase ASH1L-like [Scophthalmus maximus]
MDQRVKGGIPPTTNSPLDPTSAPEDSGQDQVAEKKRRGEGENGEVGKKEDEKKGAGRKREGDKGAVLELLIEGRCGSAGQQQLQISGRETSCPEGNVRVRIGLQAKRTKKPPKILESYVCKPTIRTYQRQGRGGLLRGDEEPPPGLSTKAIPAEEPLLGCNGVQKAPVLVPSPMLQCAAQSKSSPKKRGRPPKRPLPVEQRGDSLNPTDDTDRSKDFHSPEKGNRKLKIRRLINEMKKRKKRRLHKVMLSGYEGMEDGGGGWGGLGQSWMKFGSLGGPGFGNSNPSWRGFTGEQHGARLIASDGEDEDGEDLQESNLYRTSPSPTHTNLFTSAAVTTGGRGPKSGLASRNSGSDDRSWRRDEPAWRERRDAGLQGDPRSRGQQKSVPTSDSMAVKNKRRPGRPRKHPLPFTVPSPTHLSAPPSMSSLDLLPGHNRDGREVGGRKDERLSGRDQGGNTMQRVTEVELQARKKRGRKRKHGDSPCHQSVAVDKPECDTLPECFEQSEVIQAPSQPETVQREERADDPPKKKFLTAGLYSDDYKTTDPPSQAQQICRERLEYTPGEHEYTLLPAPIHVGKYLRMKRIHFQLPYDVMWLWQHNQEESSSDITSLFPHLDMEPLTGSERSFVVKHHVFLVRNWELVRERQIRLRIERERERERERDAEGEEGDSRRLSCDGANGDDSHIKSDQPVGMEVTVISSDPLHQSQDTSSLHTACPLPSKTQDRQEEEGPKENRGEEEVCSREQRQRRLNDLLLTLQQS